MRYYTHLMGKFRTKEKGPSSFLLPDATVFVPLFVLFITTLNGFTVGDAFHNSFQLFFSAGPGLVYWGQVVVLNLLLYSYVFSIFVVTVTKQKGCTPSPEVVDRAMQHLNNLPMKVVGITVLVFVFGEFIRLGVGIFDGPGFFGHLLTGFGEASVTGLFVGAILAMQFENRLFHAREAIISLGPRVPLKYAPLFGKIFLILLAIVAFMTFQTFSSMGSFFALGLQKPGSGGALGSQLLTGPELMFKTSQFSGMKDVLDVFGVRIGLLSIFVFQLIWQMKQSLRHPLGTVIKHLKILNSPAMPCDGTITILQNDEYAPVFKEINTLMRKQQGQIQVTEKRLEGIVTHAPDPIVAFDSQRKIRLFNPAAQMAFGYSAEEMIDQDLDRLLSPCTVDFVGAHEEGLARFEWSRQDGSRVLMESHLSQMGQDDQTWTTVILRDITNQAELEKTLTHARVEAETASRMKSEFLANMSHELRTPLNAILGFTQLMGNDKNLTSGQKDRIQVISRSGEHLLALINDILDISKIEAGKMELHTSIFDLPQFISDLREMFALKTRSKGLTLYTDTLEGLPRYVEGDLGKLRQVMINLMGNAVKFTSEGGISILVGREGDRVKFAIQDTGRGIPLDEQEMILQPFVQASTTDHEGGTGLGLAISSRYVEMMGGKLELQSALGEGSIFSFSLDLKETSQSPELEDSGVIAIAVKPGHEVTALIVDDQLTNRLVLKEMLERAGFQVVEAENGRQAVERARELKPDMIFMDIKMPILDGYGAVKEIKEDPGIQSIKVFALTASAFSHDEKKILDAGFDGFLAKPFKQSRLYRLIKEKSGVELLYETAQESIPNSHPADLKPLDFQLALWGLGKEGLEKLTEGALIGDYGALVKMAEVLEPTAPAFSQALKYAAESFNEGSITALLEGVEKEVTHG